MAETNDGVVFQKEHELKHEVHDSKIESNDGILIEPQASKETEEPQQTIATSSKQKKMKKKVIKVKQVGSTVFESKIQKRYPLFAEMLQNWYSVSEIDECLSCTQTNHISLTEVYLNAAKNISLKNNPSKNRFVIPFYSTIWSNMSSTKKTLEAAGIGEIANACTYMFDSRSHAEQIILCERICKYIEDIISAEMSSLSKTAQWYW